MEEHVTREERNACGDLAHEDRGGKCGGEQLRPRAQSSISTVADRKKIVDCTDTAADRYQEYQLRQQGKSSDRIDREQRDDEDEPAHGGRTGLNSMRLRRVLIGLLTNIEAAEEPDQQPRAEPSDGEAEKHQNAEHCKLRTVHAPSPKSG